MIKDLDLLKKRVNFSRYSFFEEMERQGIVGPGRGAKAREVFGDDFE